MDKAHLPFIGDRGAPADPTIVARRRPILGSGERPRELARMAAVHSTYVRSAGELEPAIASERISEGIWRLDVPIDNVLAGAFPVEDLIRAPANTLLRETDSTVSHKGYRPEWTDVLYEPRLGAVDPPPRLRRLQGRRVEPAWVFGRDDRSVFRNPAWPWGLVGRIFSSNGTSGTGTLVGDRLVVTAGHVVPWHDKPGWMRFVPAYYDGVSLHGPGVESYITAARGYDTGRHVAGYDWAILRLLEPLGSWLGYFGYNGYSEDWEDRPYWSIIGYPGAVANAMRPSFQGHITINDLDSDDAGGAELESDTADISAGNSGGPLFGWWAGDPRVVGVVSGQEEYDLWITTVDRDNIMASGEGLTNLIAWGRKNWPT